VVLEFTQTQRPDIYQETQILLNSLHLWQQKRVNNEISELEAQIFWKNLNLEMIKLLKKLTLHDNF